MTCPGKGCEQGASNKSRRGFLGLVAAAAALIGLPRVAAAVDKLRKVDVAYRDAPKGKQRCDNCRVWEPPNSCKSVEGEIAPQGWCNIWRKQIVMEPQSLDPEGKLSQGDVAYRDYPKGKQRCDNCRVFVAPDACNSVQGKIAPQGWCNIWRKA
jgi:hypothetical protein